MNDDSEADTLVVTEEMAKAGEDELCRAWHQAYELDAKDLVSRVFKAMNEIRLQSHQQSS